MNECLGYPSKQIYRGLNLYDLPLNHAYVVANTSVDNVNIYSVADGCYHCPYKLEKSLEAGKEVSWAVDTSVKLSWRILTSKKPATETIERNFKSGWLCQMRPSLKEYGVYRLDVGRCELANEVDPPQTYYPLFIFAAMIFALFLVYSMWRFFYKRRNNKSKDDKAIQINIPIEENMLYVLHKFRNILMCLLIFVTTGGGGYSIFSNSWYGLRAADCIFFAFVWTIGFTIPSSMDKIMLKKSKCHAIIHILKRALILMFLGTAIDSTVAHHNHPGSTLWCPLQRIGVAYFIVAAAYVLTVNKFVMKSKLIICKAIGNLVTLLWCWILACFLLAIMFILMSTFISFNCLAGASLDPTEDNGDTVLEATQNCNSENSLFANKIFVAENSKIINANAYLWFSKGLMGVISTVLVTLIGLKAGIIYLHFKSHSERILLWCFWATFFGLGGFIVSALSYPLEFNLWPISSLLFVTSATVYLFTIIYLIFEGFAITSSIFKTNTSPAATFLILCGHLLFSNSLPFNWGIALNSHVLVLLQNLWTMSLWIVIGEILRGRVSFDI